MKKSLIFGLAAVTCAAWILVGCEQEAETKTEYVDVPGPGSFLPPADAVTATSDDLLQVLLADTGGNYNHIIYGAAPAVAITVPAGKTLYLNAGSDITLSAGIAVNGKVVVYGGADFTPGAYLTGAGTLDVEAGGSLAVTDDALFTGAGKLGSVNVKKWGRLTTTAAVDTDAKIKDWLTRAGQGSLTLTVTTLTPSATLAAIGTRSWFEYGGYTAPTVTVTNNVAPAGGETTLTVPAGVGLTTNDALSSVTTLTVNGALNAANATFASAGVTITLGAKAQVVALGTIAKLAANITVPSGAVFNLTDITDSDGKTVTFTKGGQNIISDVNLTFSGISSSTGWTLDDDITLAAGQSIIIPQNAKVVVKAGKTITNNGTIVLEDGASLVLATAATDSVGKIAGTTGKLIAGATTISGAWEAVAATTTAGTVTIESGASGVGATITADGTNGTGLKASAAGATITQAAGNSSNALTIAANTEIELTGGAAPVGAIVLKGATSDAGTLSLPAATSVILTTVGGDTAGSALGSATGLFVTTAADGKALCSAIDSSSGVVIYKATTATTKLFKITGGSSPQTIKATASSTASDVTINAASAVS